MTEPATPEIFRQSAEMVRRAERFAATTLSVDPAGADLVHLPKAHFDEMAALGLYGVDVPDAHGVLPVTIAARRAITEAVSAACPSTWFVWTQHVGTAARIGAAQGDEARALLPHMATGEVRMATAYSDLRHQEPSVHATRVAGGYQFDGRVSLMTGWGYTTHAVLGGVTDGGDAVFGIVPAVATPDFNPSLWEPIELDVMGTTGTGWVKCSSLFVPDSMLLGVEPLAAFQEADNNRTASTSAGTFGIARAILNGWADIVGTDNERLLATAARIEECRSNAYEFMDRWKPDKGIGHRREHRAFALLTTSHAAAQFHTAAGAKAVMRSHPANRYRRVADFLKNQAITADMRQVLAQEEARLVEWIASPVSENALANVRGPRDRTLIQPRMTRVLDIGQDLGLPPGRN